MNDKVIKETSINQKVQTQLIYFFETASIEEIEECWALFNSKNKQ